MQQDADAWTLTDGHAGNLRQAQALAAAMGLSAPVREWTLAARAPWRWVAPRRLPGAAHAFGASFAHAMATPPALAIGCGRQAALATRLLRARGARTVQILDPRVSSRHWDIVVVPEHDRVRGGNVVTLLGSLHPVDDLWLAAARQQFAAFAALPRPRVALLLGGPSAHARFGDRQWACWFDALAARLDADGGSVLATLSRRTPPEAGRLLRERLSGYPGLIWCGQADGPNPYAGLLGWADRIVCTADSVNMLSEAAATNAPVFALGVADVHGRPRRFVDRLVAMGRVRDGIGTLEPFTAPALRETARVAAEVRRRLQL